MKTILMVMMGVGILVNNSWAGGVSDTKILSQKKCEELIAVNVYLYKSNLKRMLVRKNLNRANEMGDAVEGLSQGFTGEKAKEEHKSSWGKMNKDAKNRMIDEILESAARDIENEKQNCTKWISDRKTEKEWDVHLQELADKSISVKTDKLIMGSCETKNNSDQCKNIKSVDNDIQSALKELRKSKKGSPVDGGVGPDTRSESASESSAPAGI
jgi:hypothetical protein